jgi:hypothetical protein
MTRAKAPGTDGRNARSAKTKAALLNSCRVLMRTEFYQPEMATVCLHAKVSIRSGFQHFRNIRNLWREAIDDDDTFDAIANSIFGAAVANELALNLLECAVRAAVLHDRRADA